MDMVVRTIDRRRERMDTYYYNGEEQGMAVNTERPTEADVIARLSKDAEFNKCIAKSSRLGDIVSKAKRK